MGSVSFSKRRGPRRLFRSTALALAAAVFILNHCPAMTELRNMPSAVFAESEEELLERIGAYSPKGLSAAVDSQMNERLGTRSAVLFSPLGLPLKSIPVYVGERAGLAPGGDPVGISIRTGGVLIVGVGEFRDRSGKSVSPAASAGLKPGDNIISANGREISSSQELSRLVSDSPEGVELEIEREGKSMTVRLVPLESQDGELRMGAWVRDSTVGVGTLSFYEPDTLAFAALGHPVLDPDTGSLMSVRSGKLVSANILGVTKGRQGSPGELHGTFSDEGQRLGSISANTELGIGGVLEKDAGEQLSRLAVPLAFPDEVRIGDAVILSSASGRIEEYSCRIIRTCRQREPAPKGLVIEITDERLLELTGGIVQGMSGSPILQDGRLVGAVTHVFVNDPRKGYGAYAYWMYKEFGG